MCGITGIFNYKTKTEVPLNILSNMTGVLKHRGPDDFQLYRKGPCGLGFTRLSIIDHETGTQPITSRDGRYSLVFNGEIYNYIELQQVLKELRLEDQGDAEVILGLFELGEKYPEKWLSGMFTFALYDSFTNVLVLSRDRLGKKPLFWAPTSRGVVFLGN